MELFRCVNLFDIILEMVKAIFFDLDGTLMDSEIYYIEGTKNWLKSLNISFNEKDLTKIVGLTMDDTYKYLSHLSGLTYEDCIKYNEKYFGDNPIDFRKLIYKETKDVLKRLHEKGYILAICSMSPYNYIKKFVKDNELEKYVDFYISGDDLKNNKPAPDIYLKSLGELKLKPEEVIVVEDAYSGILSAKNAGLKVYARDASRYNVDQSKADGILSCLDDLFKILE